MLLILSGGNVTGMPNTHQKGYNERFAGTKACVPLMEVSCILSSG